MVDDLTTDDDLVLKATYYPGMKGQDSIPVIIIHGLSPKSNRKDFTQEQGLARQLQVDLGCAVIVPDLRGHGESTKWTAELQKKLREAHRPPKQPLKAEKLKPADKEDMIFKDLRTVKDWLWKKNNKKELNYDKLTVIGVEDGAVLAICFAAFDADGYGRHEVKRGTFKLGNFLKGLVLISPQIKVAGLTANVAQVMHSPQFADLRRDLPIMILAGDENNAYFSEAERLSAEFLKGRPKVNLSNKKNKPEDLTLWFYGKGQTTTKLQGAKLISEVPEVHERIERFIKSRLIENPDAKDWVWKERKSPYE